MVLLALLVAAPTVLELRRGGCYGRCPIYHVSVAADGKVEWNGERFVETDNYATKRLSKAQMEALHRAMKAARFADIPNVYDCYDVTDMPTVTVQYKDKKIVHYHGCRKEGGDKLSQLENQIDELLGTQEWISKPRVRSAVEVVPRARLSVLTCAPGTKIIIDGKDTIVVDNDKHDVSVPTGRHRYRFVAPDGREAERNFDLMEHELDIAACPR